MFSEQEAKQLCGAIQKDLAAWFQKYNLEAALTYPVLNYTGNIRTIFSLMLKPVFQGRYQAEGKGKIAFFWGGDYSERADHRLKFDKVVALCSDGFVIEKKMNPVAIMKSISELWRIPFWRYQLRNFRISKRMKWYLAACLFEIDCVIEDMKKIEKNTEGQLRLFVSFCDAQKDDSIATNFCVNHNIKTATLEHGYYDPRVTVERLAYENSQSDYFLCFGPLSKEQGIELGLPDEKMIPLGLLDFINSDKIRSNIMDTGVFGVALSFGMYADENRIILNFANILAESCNLSYVVRPHPHLSANEYMPYIDNRFGIVDNPQETVDQFTQSYDFYLIGNTGLFLTLIIQDIPVFRCGKEGSLMKFDKISWGLHWNSDTLICDYKKMRANPGEVLAQVDQVRKTIFSDGNIAQNYKDFFNQFVKE